MTIGSITVGTRKCLTVGGQLVGRTRCQLKFRVSKPYRVQLLLDGEPFSDYQWDVKQRFKAVKSQGNLTPDEEIDTVVYADLPSDNRNHTLALKDVNSSEQSTETAFISLGCAGAIFYEVKGFTENPATGELRYTIGLEHKGNHNRTLGGRVYLDRKLVGNEIPLSPRQRAEREVVIPADGKKHIIATATRIGNKVIYWTMFFVAEGNDPPVTEPGVWTSATTFDIGETILITSAVGEVPLETDGSEWILLERSLSGDDGWAPLGDDNGLILPGSDGTWKFELSTGPGTIFTGNTSWDVRARRYKDYQESDTVTHTFHISGTAYVPPGTPVPTPVITGPVNKTYRGKTIVYLSGTGPAGARLEFRRFLLTSWGTPGPVPASTTVGKDGKWRTWVQADKVGYHSYKRIAYSCRAKLNGRYSDWSNDITIRWNRRW